MTWDEIKVKVEGSGNVASVTMEDLRNALPTVSGSWASMCVIRFPSNLQAWVSATYRPRCPATSTRWCGSTSEVRPWAS